MSQEKIVKAAQDWVGKYYKQGQPAMCADFVSTVLQAAGYNQYFTQWVPDMSDEEGKSWGSRVNKLSELKAGDIILFDRTYLDETMTHVGIYVGDNLMIHRPTMAGVVEKVNLSDYWSSRFNQGRRVWVENQADDDFKIYQHSGMYKLKILKDVTFKKGEFIELNVPESSGKFGRS